MLQIRGIALISVVIFSFGLSLAYIEIETERRTANYMGIDAIVIGNRVIHLSNGDKQDTYVPYIEYQYELNRKNYTGNTSSISSSEYYNEEKVVHLLEEQYPVGSIITVYYDTNNPSNSIIHKGIQKQSVDAFEIIKTIFIISVIFFILLMLPVFQVTVKINAIIKKYVDGGILSVDELKIYESDSTSPTKLLRNSQEIKNPNSEIWLRRRKIFADSIGVGSLLTFVSIHLFVIMFLLSGTLSDIVEMANFFGLSISYIGLQFFCYSIIGIGILLYLFYMNSGLRPTDSIIGNIFVSLISYPFAVGLIMVFLSLVWFIMVGIFLSIGILLYLISISIIGNTIDFALTVKLVLFFSLIGIGLFQISTNWYENAHNKYAIIREGAEISEGIFYNNNDEMYTFDFHEDQIIIGTRKGTIILISKSKGSLIARRKVSDASITGVGVLERYIIITTTDGSIQALDRDKLTMVHELQLNSIPRSLTTSPNRIYIGMDDGSLYQMRIYNSRLNIINHKKVFSKGISVVRICNKYIFAGGENKFIKVLSPDNLQEKADIKGQKQKITDIWIDADEIFTTSLDGSVAIYSKFDLKLKQIIEFEYSYELASVIAFDDNILVGRTDGKLLIVNRKQYEIEKTVYELSEDIYTTIKGVTTYDLHKSWIEALNIHDSKLYSISSDGSLKIVDLLRGLKIPVAGVDPNTIIELQKIPVFCGICTEEIKDENIRCSKCCVDFHYKHFEGTAFYRVECPNCYRSISLEEIHR